MSSELTDRLRRAAPLPSRELTLAQLERETRRHRQRQRIAGATLGLLVIAGALVGLLSSGGGGTDRDSIAAISSAPPPVGRTVSATPSTGLQDGQIIVVRGSGYAPDVRIAMVTCGAESETLANKQDACATAQVQYASADVRGDVSTSFVVQRTIETAKLGRIDCGSAPKRCRLGVGELQSQKGASVLLTFSDKAAKASKPLLSFPVSHGPSPNPLTREVAGSGFVANRAVAIRECLPNTDCSGNAVILTVTANGSGGFLANVTMQQKISAFAGDEAWCASSCQLSATVQPETSNITALSPTFSLVGPVPDGGSVCTLASLKTSYALSTTAGAHSLQITLTNESQAPCWLNGYPSVQLSQIQYPVGGVGYAFGNGSGATAKLSGGETAELPGWVRLDPGGVSHFLLVKDDCAAGNGPIANSVDLMLPGDKANVSLRVSPQDGALALPTCHANVSNVFHVGPFSVG
jgi:hypothetical protein